MEIKQLRLLISIIDSTFIVTEAEISAFFKFIASLQASGFIMDQVMPTNPGACFRHSSMSDSWFSVISW